MTARHTHAHTQVPWAGARWYRRWRERAIVCTHVVDVTVYAN